MKSITHESDFNHENNNGNNGEGKSKILVIGATGYIGGFLAQAAIGSGHPTYAMVRPSTLSSKPNTIKKLEDNHIHVVYGSLDDKDSLVHCLKGIDVVISAVGGETIDKQMNLIEAMEHVGTIKRFYPSEFGHDIDKADPVEPGLNLYKAKREIRQAVKNSKIPYTYICCNSIASWPYFDNTHPSEIPPPTDHFVIYGDGNVKAYFVTGEDIAKFTIKTVEDPRAVNKIIHFRPEKNFVTMNEMANLWEGMIEKTLPRTYISEKFLLDMAKENKIPQSIVASLTHDIFFNGCQYKFEIDGRDELEVSELYPMETYITLEDFFAAFLVKQTQ